MSAGGPRLAWAGRKPRGKPSTLRHARRAWPLHCAFTAETGTQANPQRFEEMMLIVTAVAVLLTSLSILLAFIVLEGDVLPQEWAKFLPPAKATLQPHELVWANNRP